MSEWKQPRLSAAENATLRLRGLYEQFGYRKYQVRQFEEYGLYVQFSNFLTGNRILSFTDLDGRLLALKPDVTLSIAKNAQLDGSAVKAYYIENVYRESVSSGTIKEINQMGLEFLGGPAGYAPAEVLRLAYETLSAIGPGFVLDVSHMGFVQGLFDALGLVGEPAGAVLQALSARSAHGVETAARAAGVGSIGLNVLTELCRLAGSFSDTLVRARGLCLNAAMTSALDALERTVEAIGSPEGIRLDLTLQGDMEYYDGLMMAGWLDGVPKPVLAGGQYDGLMKKLGREVGAVGFALYLDDLSRIAGVEDDLTADVLLVAGPEAAPEAVMARVLALTAQGKRVRVDSGIPNKQRFGTVIRFGEEEPSC